MNEKRASHTCKLLVQRCTRGNKGAPRTGVSRRTFGTYIWTDAATWAEEEEAGSIKSKEVSARKARVGKGRTKEGSRTRRTLEHVNCTVRPLYPILTRLDNFLIFLSLDPCDSIIDLLESSLARIWHSY